jgi:uncharacterized protein GlcG (DUF336 family)
MSKLTLKQANTIIDKALAKAREMKIKPLGVVVLDASGHLVAAQREDGASMFRLDVARGKAWGAVAMGCSSRALAKRAKDNPNFMVTLAATAEGKFLPQRRRWRQRRHGRGGRGLLCLRHRAGGPDSRRFGLTCLSDAW